jgi:hypothetical protein
MEKLELAMSWIAFICGTGIFLTMIINSSPMKGLAVFLGGIIFIISYLLLRMGYKEYRDEQSRNNK